MEEHKNTEVTDEILVGYREYLRDEKRNQATVEKYLWDVKAFVNYLGTGQEANRERVRDYREALRERYKIISASSILATLNSFFAFAKWEELRAKPYRVQRVMYSRKELEMTEKDYGKLIRAARKDGDEKVGVLIQATESTGIQISELKFIAVEALETRRAEIYNKGKSRVVLLLVESTKLLRKYCKPVGVQTGSIFTTHQGNPVDRDNMSKKVKQLGQEAGAGTARISPHSLHHLLAKTFYSIEKDVIRLMSLLGHFNISTTGIYTAATEEQPRRQLSRMSLILGQPDNDSRK